MGVTYVGTEWFQAEALVNMGPRAGLRNMKKPLDREGETCVYITIGVILQAFYCICSAFEQDRPHPPDIPACRFVRSRGHSWVEAEVRWQ